MYRNQNWWRKQRMFLQLTWGSCGRRSWMLYLTQAITALKTCSSLRTLSSSLEIISINWLAGSSMNSSLSMTCEIRAVCQQQESVLHANVSYSIRHLTHNFKIIHQKYTTNMTFRGNTERNTVQLSLPPESCVGWTCQQCGAARDRSVCQRRPWFPDSWKDRAVSSGIHSRPPESQPAGEGKQQEVASGRFPPQQSPGDGGDTLHLRSFLVAIVLTLLFFLLINGYRS